MNKVASAVAFGRRQAKNLVKLAQGNLVVAPSLGSMTLEADDVRLAKQWLNSPREWFRNEETKQFHERFAEWNGSAHAYSFMSGRVALSAIIHALGLQPEDEVIIPGYTCVVVPNAFDYAGVRVVYADIELDTYGLDVAHVESKITAKTKAILLHHVYGLVCRDYEKTIELARANNLLVIEDCAQSTGAEFCGRKIGNLGDAAFYSSEQSKIFNTLQGGVATTNDAAIAARLEDFYNRAPYPDEARLTKHLKQIGYNYHTQKHPQRWWRRDVMNLISAPDDILISTNKGEEEGIKPPDYGCKMPAPVAALAINQLNKIDAFNARRRETAARWDAWCDEHEYNKPLVIENSLPTFLRYPVMVEPERKRDRAWALTELGVAPGVWFSGQLHPTTRRVEGCDKAAHAVAGCINFPTLMS